MAQTTTTKQPRVSYELHLPSKTEPLSIDEAGGLRFNQARIKATRSLVAPPRPVSSHAPGLRVPALVERLQLDLLGVLGGVERRACSARVRADGAGKRSAIMAHTRGNHGSGSPWSNAVAAKGFA